MRPGVDSSRGGDGGSKEEGGKGGVRVYDGKGGAETMVKRGRVVSKVPFLSSGILFIPVIVVVAFGVVVVVVMER